MNTEVLYVLVVKFEDKIKIYMYSCLQTKLINAGASMTNNTPELHCAVCVSDEDIL